MAEQNPFLSGPYAPVEQEITAFDLPVTGDPAARNWAAATCVTGRTRWAWRTRLPLGRRPLVPGRRHGARRPAARRPAPSGTATAGSGPGRWRRPWARNGRVARSTTTRTSRPTRTSSGTAGALLATVEAGPLPYQLTDELETVGPCDFGGKLPGGYAAHTKLDRRTGELHAIAYYWAWDYVQHVVVDAAGQVIRTAEHPGPGRADDARLRAHRAATWCCSTCPSRSAWTRCRPGWKLPYTWNAGPSGRGSGCCRAPGGPTSIRWFEIEPCWVFHTLNAYDDGDRVVVDLVPVRGAVRRLGPGGEGPADAGPVDHRPGRRARSASRACDDRAQEFPRVDDRIVSQPHRYGYSAAIGEVSRDTVSLSGDFADGAFANALLKHDLTHGTHRGARVRPGRHRRRGGVRARLGRRRRGRRLRAGLHPQPGARRRRPGPAGRAGLHRRAGGARPPAGRIPLGFHGNWLPDQ